VKIVLISSLFLAAACWLTTILRGLQRGTNVSVYAVSLSAAILLAATAFVAALVVTVLEG